MKNFCFMIPLVFCIVPQFLFVVYIICYQFNKFQCLLGAIMVTILWQLDLQLTVQSVSIHTKVVSSNPVHGEVLDTTLCDKVCQWLATGQWFCPGTPVSSTNKTDHLDITEILLKVVLNTINQPTNHQCLFYFFISSPGHRPCELLSWVSVRRLSIRQLFTFKSSSLKPLNRNQPNMPEMFTGWSSTRFVFLVLI